MPPDELNPEVAGVIYTGTEDLLALLESGAVELEPADHEPVIASEDVSHLPVIMVGDVPRDLLPRFVGRVVGRQIPIRTRPHARAPRARRQRTNRYARSPGRQQDSDDLPPLAREALA